MREKGISIGTVALLLGIHRNSASNKVNGETEFTVTEALKLQRDLFPEYTMQYLFSGKERR